MKNFLKDLKSSVAEEKKQQINELLDQVSRDFSMYYKIFQKN